MDEKDDSYRIDKVLVIVCTVINCGLVIAIGELVCLHIYLILNKTTTLEYLRNKDKVRRESKVTVRITRSPMPEETPKPQ